MLTAILVAGSPVAAAQVAEPVVVLHSAPKHVCDPAAAAVAEIVYPVSHVEQSTPATSQITISKDLQQPIAGIRLPRILCNICKRQPSARDTAT